VRSTSRENNRVEQWRKDEKREGQRDREALKNMEWIYTGF
jgi:hypothetical protein